MSNQDDMIAFENTFPGVRALTVSIWAMEYDFECDAPGETLAAVGLISPTMLQRMKGMSSQIGFGPRPNLQANYCPYYTTLRYRTAKGRPTNTLTMRRYGAKDVAAFCESIGVHGPTEADIAAARAHTAATEAKLRESLRAAYDAGVDIRRAGRKLWSSNGVLISVDWDEVRGRVAALRRRAGALSS